MKTWQQSTRLGLYASDCCSEELIFDVGDTFCRCLKCVNSCQWELVSKLTRAPLESEVGAAA